MKKFYPERCIACQGVLRHILCNYSQANGLRKVVPVARILKTQRGHETKVANSVSRGVRQRRIVGNLWFYQLTQPG